MGQQQPLRLIDIAIDDRIQQFAVLGGGLLEQLGGNDFTAETQNGSLSDTARKATFAAE